MRELLAEQFPGWAELPIEPMPAQGTVNALFRIGTGLAARFPLRPGEMGATRRWLETEAAAIETGTQSYRPRASKNAKRQR